MPIASPLKGLPPEDMKIRFGTAALQSTQHSDSQQFQPQLAQHSSDLMLLDASLGEGDHQYQLEPRSQPAPSDDSLIPSLHVEDNSRLQSDNVFSESHRDEDLTDDFGLAEADGISTPDENDLILRLEALRHSYMPLEHLHQRRRPAVRSPSPRTNARRPSPLPMNIPTQLGEDHGPTQVRTDASSNRQVAPTDDTAWHWNRMFDLDKSSPIQMQVSVVGQSLSGSVPCFPTAEWQNNNYNEAPQHPAPTSFMCKAFDPFVRFYLEQ